MPHTYVCQRTRVPVPIDGRLDHDVWQAAPWTTDFVDIEGDKKPKPRFRTRAKMLWDETYLYIGAELEEPEIWATLTEHDSVIFQDNDFEVFIDPDGDNHMYGEFEMNAFNTTWDLLLPKPYRDGGPAINGWEIHGLRSAVHIDGTINDPSTKDKGWSLTLALPIATYAEIGAKTPIEPGMFWRINFSRVEWEVVIEDGKYKKVKKPEDNWVWSPQGAIDMHRPEQWGILQFEDGDTAVKPYPGLAERELLMRVYYAQREFRTKHGHWATHAKDLGFDDKDLRVFATPNLYEAIFGEWHVDQSSKLWHAPAGAAK